MRGEAPGARRPPHVPEEERAWLARHPLLRWLARWGISLVSLGLGLTVLFVFRRGLPHVAWIVGYILLLWIVFALITELRAPLEEKGKQLVVSAAEYTIQTLHHNLLLFVLPAYYAAVTLTSLNAVFLAAVAGAALLTAVDPWYRHVVHPRPSLTHLLLGFSIFAALNVALPLVGVRPIFALEGSALLAMIAITPALRRHRGLTWRRALTQAAALACLAAVAVWFGRVAIPPAPLFLARAIVAQNVTMLEPVEPVEGGVIPAATMAEWGGLAAYTAIYAPAGLRQAVDHVWYRDGQFLTRIPLATPVRGGRTQGFRTYSRYQNPKPPLPGRYTVDVMTAAGQLIGRLRFTVTP